MKKYYFISYFEKRKNDINFRPINAIIDMHPFDWQINNKIIDFTDTNPDYYSESIIISFQEISKDEYLKYNEKINKYEMFK